MSDYMLRVLRRRDRRDRKARCTITRGDFPDHAIVDTDVPCRVRPHLTDHLDSGGEQVTVYRYDVGLDFRQDIRLDDAITIDETADPLLAGLHLTVVEVTVDEWVTSRIVVCKRSE